MRCLQDNQNAYVQQSNLAAGGSIYCFQKIDMWRQVVILTRYSCYAQGPVGGPMKRHHIFSNKHNNTPQSAAANIQQAGRQA
jgi:hypothetical protein